MRQQRMKCKECNSLNVTTTSNYERRTEYYSNSNPKTTLKMDYAGARGLQCRDCGELYEF